MSIPNFKNEEDWKQFQYIFDEYWSRKLELLTTVKNGLFSGYKWETLTPKSIEVINDITQTLLYDAECTFKEEHPEYKTEDDEIFIPRRSFKEDCAEALKEALSQDCPPCDTLACADHLADE